MTFHWLTLSRCFLDQFLHKFKNHLFSSFIGDSPGRRAADSAASASETTAVKQNVFIRTAQSGFAMSFAL